MILLAFILAQTAPAAAPSEAQALGARLAQAGSIMALLPLVAGKDVEELIAAHPELSAAERATLRTTADATLRQGMARIAQAFGVAYAKRLSLAELRVLVAQAESPEARRLRAVQPQAMAEAIGALGTLDFKRDVVAAFCRDTGQLCPPAERR